MHVSRNMHARIMHMYMHALLKRKHTTIFRIKFNGYIYIASTMTQKHCNTPTKLQIKIGQVSNNFMLILSSASKEIIYVLKFSNSTTTQARPYHN